MKNRTPLVWICRVICLWLLGAVTPGWAGQDGLHKLTLQLKWQHQFQFAGYYAAQEKGYYRAAGLDVEIRAAAPGEDALDQVLAGRAQYGVGNSSLLLRRHQGADVVVLATIFQHSPLVLLARQSGAITALSDLQGRPVLLEPMSDELTAYLQQEGVQPQLLVAKADSSLVDELLAGRVDAISAYITDEPYRLEQAGFPYRMFSPRVAGIGFYGDNLFTTEAELQAQPERVRAFVAASLKGWRYAMQHPEEIVDLILARYGERHEREALLHEARQMHALIQPDLVELGYMNPERWRQIARTYAKLGMLPEDFSLNGFLHDPDSLGPAALSGNQLLSMVVLGALALLFLGVSLHIARLNRRLRQAMAEMVDVQARLQESEARLQLQATRDALTGLFNRRYLDEILDQEIAQARRQGKPLAVVMLDLDRFKLVNDTYGHQAGDEVLKALGALLREDSRQGDILCRYGGEEFCLVFPDMPLAAAMARTDVWRQRFAAQTRHFGDFSFQVSFSAGVAVYPEHGTRRDELLERADAALYAAKHQGRNKVLAAQVAAEAS